MNIPNLLTVLRVVMVMIFVLLAANAGPVFFQAPDTTDRRCCQNSQDRRSGLQICLSGCTENRTPGRYILRNPGSR